MNSFVHKLWTVLFINCFGGCSYSPRYSYSPPFTVPVNFSLVVISENHLLVILGDSLVTDDEFLSSILLCYGLHVGCNLGDFPVKSHSKFPGSFSVILILRRCHLYWLTFQIKLHIRGVFHKHVRTSSLYVWFWLTNVIHVWCNTVQCKATRAQRNVTVRN